MNRFPTVEEFANWSQKSEKLLMGFKSEPLRQPKASLARYLNLWMPLVLKYAIEGDHGHILTPPSDIAWFWYVHRLNTIEYARFCVDFYKKRYEVESLDIMELHDVITLFEATSSLSTIQVERNSPSQIFWESVYPTQSYFLSESTEIEGDFSDFEYLLKASRTSLKRLKRRNSHSKYEMTPSYDDYIKFLHLAKITGSDYCVPRQDIAWIWACHVSLSPVNYSKSSLFLVGRHLPYQESEFDGEEFKKTKMHWKSMFNEEYTHCLKMNS